MDIFDQFLIRGVKIIFLKGPSLVMEERQLLGEVMLKYPLLFSLLPESSRDDTMKFLKKKMLDLGVQRVDELNCFRVMNGHLYWEMMLPTPLADFDLALEEFLFRERLESAVKSLAYTTEEHCDISYPEIAVNVQNVEVSPHSPVTMATQHVQNGENLRSMRYQCTGIHRGDTLSRTIHLNHGNTESFKEDGSMSVGEFFGTDFNGTGQGFQDFKVEKRFDHSYDFQNEYRAITFHPVKENLNCNEMGENRRHGLHDVAISSEKNNIDRSCQNLSYDHGNQQFNVHTGPIFTMSNNAGLMAFNHDQYNQL